MGTRMTGMVFPFNGSKEDIQGIIYKWMQHEAILLDRYKEIHVNFWTIILSLLLMLIFLNPHIIILSCGKNYYLSH